MKNRTKIDIGIILITIVHTSGIIGNLWWCIFISDFSENKLLIWSVFSTFVLIINFLFLFLRLEDMKDSE